MHLTEGQPPAPAIVRRPIFPPAGAAAAIAAGLLCVFLLDRVTGGAPFPHLYYLPIMFAAIRFGQRGAWSSGAGAILLYHIANPEVLPFAHAEHDIVQVVLFVTVGLVTARLRDDARRLETLAGTDDLTGLLNLRAFEGRLRDAVGRARAARRPLSLLVLDVDGLKGLNDTHGHLAGAEAVRTVGHIIASRLPPLASACRYGGDEFVVALPDSGLPGAETVASSILEDVHAVAPTLAGVTFLPGTLSVSIGLACLPEQRVGGVVGGQPDDDDQGEALFRAADAALYEAKRSGRGRVCAARGPSGDVS